MSEKLIRDRIPEIAEQRGQQLKVRKASTEEMPGLLMAKLSEEYREVLAAEPDELLDELADLIEVAYALAQLHGHSATALEMARSIKRHERGSFVRRLVLHMTD